MDKLYYKEYYILEREHWWFKARLEILESMVAKRIGSSEDLQILNAGAATGATSIMLKNYGAVTSLEYDEDCATFLSKELGEEVLNESLTALSMSANSYDLVCAFDVIEHIEDHNLAVQEMARVLKKDGRVFITVPAFQFMWSRHDDINHHFRRYRLKELISLLENNGFEVEFPSYFNSILFLPIAVIRLLSSLAGQKKSSDSTGSDFEKFNSSGLLNRLLYRIFKLEMGPLKAGIHLPFGVSAMIIGKKK